MLGETYHNSWSIPTTTITSTTSTYDTTPRGVRGNFTSPPANIGNTWSTHTLGTPGGPIVSGSFVGGNNHFVATGPGPNVENRQSSA